jgi:hypothetical protein
VTLPLSRKGFIAEPFDRAQTRWTGNRGDVQPLFVTLVLWCRIKLLLDLPVLLDAAPSITRETSKDIFSQEAPLFRDRARPTNGSDRGRFARTI